jgi:hypothetical protein
VVVPLATRVPVFNDDTSAESTMYRRVVKVTLEEVGADIPI